MNIKEKLDYYMDLKYSIEITPVSEKDGGGYEASIPQLGKHAFCGYGDTVEQALANLKEIKGSIFSYYLEKGVSIPEPEEEDASIFSGKFIIRVPKKLHYKLAKEAKKNSVSLNYYVSSLLSWAVGCYPFYDKKLKQEEHINYKTIQKKLKQKIGIEESKDLIKAA